ncbi:unnamed protein product [Phytomonas sp. EM1]|nr:unnamed protein product [Phytomonas sp. EM1]|eukprot:CCW65382.1 unnamed protein product [Phytomonas sp. isolate EM1]
MFLRSPIRRTSFHSSVSLCGLVHNVSPIYQKEGTSSLDFFLTTQHYITANPLSSLGGPTATTELLTSRVPSLTSPPTVPPPRPGTDNMVDTSAAASSLSYQVEKECYALCCLGTAAFIQSLKLIMQEETILSVVGSARTNTQRTRLGPTSHATIVVVYQQKLRSTEHALWFLHTPTMPLLSAQRQLRRAVFGLSDATLREDIAMK